MNKIMKACLFLALLTSINNANELESGTKASPQIPSQIREPDENIVNSQSIKVYEKDGALQSAEQEVIDLYMDTGVEEKVDYTHCAKFYKQASVNLGNGLYAIKLKNGNSVVTIGYNPTRPNIKNLLRYDPFSGLFLVNDGNSKYAYEMSNIDEYALSKELVSVGAKGAKVGRFKDYQKSFLLPATFSIPTQRNGVISNICYKIYGLSIGKNGFLEKKYIDRFLSQSQTYYGDIGVRFKILDANSATFEVEYADPFFPNNPFKKGDILISINDFAAKDWGELEWQISNLEQNSKVKIKIRRDGEIKNMEVKVGKRYGGMLLTDSFLERFDIDISRDFVVQHVPSKGAFSKLRAGDKILFIDDIDMRHLHVDNNAEKHKLFRELFTSIQDNQVDFLESKKMQKVADAKHYGEKDILEQFQSKGVTQNRQNSFYRKMSENMSDFRNKESNRGSIPNLNAPSTKDLHSFSGDGILRDSSTQSMQTIYDIYGADVNVGDGGSFDSGMSGASRFSGLSRGSESPSVASSSSGFNDGGGTATSRADIRSSGASSGMGDRIRNYEEELRTYNGKMTFLIDRQGFQFRVPLE